MHANVATRRTLDNDNVVFPSYQFWTAGNVAWWALDYVYIFYRRNALTSLKRCKWLADVGNIIHGATMDGDTVHFRKAPANSDSHQVQAPVATSRGLLPYFSHVVNALRPVTHQDLQLF